MGVADDMWHHVCVLWNNRKRLMQVFKDGERRFGSFEFHLTPNEGTLCRETIYILLYGFSKSVIFYASG